MNTRHSFVAERVAAQHCAELLRSGPAPAELLPVFRQAGERVARLIGPMLADLLGGDDPKVTAAPPEQLNESDLDLEVGPLAANSLIASPACGMNLLASIDGQATLRLVDRAFGGPGETSGPLPDSFPLSAEIMIQRLDEMLVACLSRGLALPDLVTLRRDSRLIQLSSFPRGTRLAAMRLEIVEGARAPWQVLIAVPLEQLALLPGGATGAAKAATDRAPADPAAEPFAEMPLPLTARLVDMRVPLSALAKLEPGTVLPVAVARAVPIAIGETIIARGTVGAADDRVAVKLTQIS